MADYDRHLLDGEHLGHLISKIKTLNATRIEDPSQKTDGQILGYDATEGKWLAIDAPNSAVWGQITGTLSAQTDLQNVLDAKQNELTPGEGFTIDDDELNYDPEVISSVEYVDANISDTMSYVIQEDNEEKAARQAGDELLQGAIDAEEARALAAEALKANSADLGTAAAKDYIGTVTSGSDALVTSGAVHSAIAGLTGFHFEIVQVLPEEGETNVIYLVLKSQSQSGNVYTEYAWINNNWEILGDTAIELEYLTKKNFELKI